MRTVIAEKTVGEFCQFAQDLHKKDDMDAYECTIYNLTAHLLEDLKARVEGQYRIPFSLAMMMGMFDSFMSSEARMEEDDEHYYFIFSYDELFHKPKSLGEYKFWKEIQVAKEWELLEDGGKALKVVNERNYTDPPDFDHDNPHLTKEVH